MRSRTALIIAVTAVLAAAGAAVYLLRARGPRPYNLVLISVDTLRPDRLGYAGHVRDTSPTIDRLAREGLVFENCYSVAGWTLPAMATIFTGRYPRDHGATDVHWAMDVALPTLAGILRKAGYDTRGYVSHVVLRPSYGVAEGFASYDFSVLNHGHPHNVATAKPLTDLVLKGLETIEEPYFLWVHYFDPHFQYLRHRPWSAFGDRDIDRYDQEIAHTDSNVSRLLAGLRRHGLDDNTIIIFTSDHGEEFGEHGAKYHYTLYEEVMRVPLVIKAPFINPGVDRSVVEQIDLLPTILAMLEIDPGGVDLPGRDLLGPTGGTGPVFVERDRPPPYNQRGIIHRGYKLTVIGFADTTRIPVTSRGTYVPITNVHPGIYMYDLSADPGETRNIYSEDDPRAKELLVMLAEHFAVEATPVREVKVDEELREKLRSLGYLR